jgi:hypothetical protein
LVTSYGELSFWRKSEYDKSCCALREYIWHIKQLCKGCEFTEYLYATPSDLSVFRIKYSMTIRASRSTLSVKVEALRERREEANKFVTERKSKGRLLNFSDIT